MNIYPEVVFSAVTNAAATPCMRLIGMVNAPRHASSNT